jgi:hypothetical protein
MTEAEWLKCTHPSEMLRCLQALKVSERKVILFLLATRLHEVYERSRSRQVICAALDQFAEGIITREELSAVYQAEGMRIGPPPSFTPENASYWLATTKEASKLACRVIREVFGNPFRPVAFSPEWKTDTAMSLAKQMYEAREFGAMPILADALQDAGCDSADVLNHCRGAGPHVRGCWVVDLVLGKE